MPALSIITVCFNNREGLKKTIRSVLDQEFINYEFIIIDGGSTDGTVELIDHNRQHINYWVSEKDNGIYAAMNKGISVSKGKYCIFLNAGDCFANNLILKKVFHSNPNEDVVYGNVIRYKSKRIKHLIKYPTQISLYDFYKRSAPIHHQATFIRRILFDQFGKYREDLKVMGDWEFFFKIIILCNCSTLHINETISIVDSSGISHIYRLEDPNIIREIKTKEKKLKDNIPEYILRDYERLDKLLKPTFLMKLKKYVGLH